MFVRNVCFYEIDTGQEITVGCYVHAVRYDAVFPVDPDDRVIMEMQCITILLSTCVPI